MCGMHGDKAHTVFFNTGLDLFRQFVLDLIVVLVSPPHKDIGIVENLIRQTLFRIIQANGSDLKGRIFGQKLRNCSVDAVGVYGLDFFHIALMTEFVPDGNSDLISHSFSPILRYFYSSSSSPVRGSMPNCLTRE